MYSLLLLKIAPSQESGSLAPMLNNVKKTIARKLGADTTGSDYLEDSMRKVNKYVRNPFIHTHTPTILACAHHQSTEWSKFHVCFVCSCSGYLCCFSHQIVL